MAKQAYPAQASRVPLKAGIVLLVAHVFHRFAQTRLGIRREPMGEEREGGLIVLQYTSAPTTGSPLLGNGRYRVCYPLTDIAKRPFTVWLADDLHTDQQVIIKHINRLAPPSSLTMQDKEAILRREEAFLRRVQHDRIAKLLESIVDGDQYTLVLSFFPGMPLEKEVLHRAAPGSQHYNQTSVVNCGLALCHLLHYLHQLNPPIIHRDVKPGNIVHCLDGTCALIDLGNAREHGSNQSQTHRQPNADTLPGIGTAGYCPPEQYGIGDIPPRTTPVSDLYSVGSILYQMVTGYNPGNKPIEDRFNYAPLTPYVRASGISTSLAELIMQMLEWLPRRRPQSAYEVITRLEWMKAQP